MHVTLDLLLTHTLSTPLSSKEAMWNDKPDISKENRNMKELTFSEEVTFPNCCLKGFQGMGNQYLL
jgi:hypothetical protein